MSQPQNWDHSVPHCPVTCRTLISRFHSGKEAADTSLGGCGEGNATAALLGRSRLGSDRTQTRSLKLLWEQKRRSQERSSHRARAAAQQTRLCLCSASPSLYEHPERCPHSRAGLSLRSALLAGLSRHHSGSLLQVKPGKARACVPESEPAKAGAVAAEPR